MQRSANYDPPDSTARERWIWESESGERLSASNIQELLEAVEAYRSSPREKENAESHTEFVMNGGRANVTLMEAVAKYERNDAKSQEMLPNTPEIDDSQKESLQVGSIKARNIDGRIQFLKCRKCDLYFSAEATLILHNEVDHNKVSPIRSLRYS